MIFLHNKTKRLIKVPTVFIRVKLTFNMLADKIKLCVNFTDYSLLIRRVSITEPYYQNWP